MIGANEEFLGSRGQPWNAWKLCKNPGWVYSGLKLDLTVSRRIIKQVYLSCQYFAGKSLSCVIFQKARSRGPGQPHCLDANEEKPPYGAWAFQT